MQKKKLLKALKISEILYLLGFQLSAFPNFFSSGLLRCFDTVFRRSYRCFSIAFKMMSSLSDRHKILTSD